MHLPDLLERGVWIPPCLDEHGYFYIVAVDSKHRVRHRQRLFSTSESEIATQTAMVKRLLDRLDPVRKPEAA